MHEYLFKSVNYTLARAPILSVLISVFTTPAWAATAAQTWLGPNGSFDSTGLENAFLRASAKYIVPGNSAWGSIWDSGVLSMPGITGPSQNFGVQYPFVLSADIPSFSAPDSKTFLASVGITTTVNAEIVARGRSDGFFPGEAITTVPWVSVSFESGPPPRLPLAGYNYYKTNTSLVTPNPIAGPFNPDRAIVGGSTSLQVGPSNNQSTSTQLVGSAHWNIDATGFTKAAAGQTVHTKLLIDVAMATGPITTYGRRPGNETFASGRTQGSASATIQYNTGELKLEWTSAAGGQLANGQPGPQYMRGLLTALDNTGRNIPINSAAQAMGFDHFNWIQTIASDIDLFNCHRNPSNINCAGLKTTNGSVPDEGTFDAPAGGWAYQTEIRAGNGNIIGYKRFPVRDSLPFYNDEGYSESGNYAMYGPTVANTRYTNLTSLSGVSNDDLKAALSNHKYNAQGLVFYDAPYNNGTTIAFDTVLVGVKDADCAIHSNPNDCQFTILSDFNKRWYSHSGIVGFNAESTGLYGSEAGSGPLSGGYITTDQFMQDSKLTTLSLAAMGGSILPAAAVLEPSSIALIATGLGVIGLTFRRRGESIALRQRLALVN